VSEGCLIGIGAIAVGCINLLFPQLIFFLREGWKFQDAKPSELFIMLTQMAGLAIISFGIVSLVLCLLL
jgi:hypothetical protein